MDRPNRSGGKVKQVAHSIALSDIAFKVGKLNVFRRVRTAPRQWPHMVEALASWVRVFEVGINLFGADATDPSVALEDVGIDDSHRLAGVSV